MDIRDLLHRLRRTVSWHRRALSAVAASCCVLCLAQVLRPAQPPTTTVLVASRALPAGATVAADDLSPAEFPSDLVPQGHRDDDLVGRVLIAPVSAGQLLDTNLVLRNDTSSGSQMVVPVPVSDASVLSMVKVGDRVTVVTAGQGGSATVVAQRVRVVLVEAAQGSSRGSLLVAADPSTAATLAAWSSTQPLGIALG